MCIATMPLFPAQVVLVYARHNVWRIPKLGIDQLEALDPWSEPGTPTPPAKPPPVAIWLGPTEAEALATIRREV